MGNTRHIAPLFPRYTGPPSPSHYRDSRRHPLRATRLPNISTTKLRINECVDGSSFVARDDLALSRANRLQPLILERIRFILSVSIITGIVETAGNKRFSHD